MIREIAAQRAQETLMSPTLLRRASAFSGRNAQLVFCKQRWTVALPHLLEGLEFRYDKARTWIFLESLLLRDSEIAPALESNCKSNIKIEFT